MVYVGPGLTTSAHSHDAIQFAWCPARTIDSGTGQGSGPSRTSLVPSRQRHTFDSGGESVAIVLVEPSGRLGHRLASIAGHDLAGDLDTRLAATRFPDTTDATTLVDWGRLVLSRVIGEDLWEPCRHIRSEVAQAQRFIDDHLHDAPLLSEAARHVGLSPRQLRRLFDAEVAIPFRRYVLWRRLRRASLAAHHGYDLTGAAAVAGFADSAHFSRTFRRTFGLSPSEILPLVTVAEADFPAL